MNLASLLIVCLASGNPRVLAEPRTQASGDGSVALDRLDLTQVRQTVGAAKRDLAFSGKPLTVGGKVYERGVGTHAESYVRLRLDGKARRFRALVGLDDGGERFWGTGVQFWIEGDGRTLAKSRPLRRGSPAVPLEADLTGVKVVTLVAAASGFGVRGDDADWIDARFEMASGTPRAEAVPDDPAIVLTPKPGPKPRLTGASVFGVRPEHPILFSVTATGERPLRFDAEGLPSGVTLDPVTGELKGRVATAGAYDVRISARNARGEAKRTLRLVVGEAIALTPPMGWNSWNSFDWRVTQAQVEGAAQVIKDKLRDHGWLYVNVDDSWQYDRGGEFDAIRPNRKFPDMKGMVDRIHALGLKAGIYSSPWMVTYAGHIGGSAEDAAGKSAWLARADATGQGGPTSLQRVGPVSFVPNDTKQFAAWGFDYLKYDWNPIDVVHTREAFDLMRASGRDLVFSLSNGARLNDAPDLAKASQLWRDSGDMSDTWGAVRQNAFGLAAWAPVQGPGHWNDEDMLLVGRVSVGEDLHPSHLSPSEQYTHISQWCLLASPLLIGCDLSALDPFTLGLLTNDEVLGIDQDPLGLMARARAPGGTPDRCGPSRSRTAPSRSGWFNLSEGGGRHEGRIGARSGGEERRSCATCGARGDVARSSKGYVAHVPRHGGRARADRLAFDEGRRAGGGTADVTVARAVDGAEGRFPKSSSIDRTIIHRAARLDAVVDTPRSTRVPCPRWIRPSPGDSRPSRPGPLLRFARVSEGESLSPLVYRRQAGDLGPLGAPVRPDGRRPGTRGSSTSRARRDYADHLARYGHPSLKGHKGPHPALEGGELGSRASDGALQRRPGRSTSSAWAPITTTSTSGTPPTIGGTR